jgi:hypothetical protein
VISDLSPSTSSDLLRESWHRLARCRDHEGGLDPLVLDRFPQRIRQVAEPTQMKSCRHERSPSRGESFAPQLADDPPRLVDDLQREASSPPRLVDDLPQLVNDLHREASPSPRLVDDPPQLVDDLHREASRSPRLVDDPPQLVDDLHREANRSPRIVDDPPQLVDDLHREASPSPRIAGGSPRLVDEARPAQRCQILVQHSLGRATTTARA